MHYRARSTLSASNLNDLIDKPKDPEKVLKQVIEGRHADQLLQVKTQVSFAPG